MTTVRYSPHDEPITLRMPPYQHHSDTSHLAAKAVKAKATTLRERVYEFLSASTAISGGCTDGEIQSALIMDPSTERPRRVELVRAGRVKDSGRKRKTKSGRLATVWVTA